VKVIHLSDLHFNQSIFHWVKERESTFDVICLTGDFLDLSNKALLSPQDQVEWIISFLNSLDKPVLLCSGNHDVVEGDVNDISLENLFNIDGMESGYEIEQDTSDEYSWLRDASIDGGYLDGFVGEIDGIIFGCMPYLAENFRRYRDCDVLLRHVPPSKTKVSVGDDGDYGCEVFAAEIKYGQLRPKYVLCGHIHQPTSQVDELCGVKLLNPGFGFKGGEPKHILFEV